MVKIDFGHSFFKSFLNIFSIICTSLCVFFVIVTLLINNSYKSKIKSKIISYDGYASIYNNNYKYLDNSDYQIIYEKLNDNFLMSKIKSTDIIVKLNGSSDAMILREIDFENLEVFSLNDILIKGKIEPNNIIVGSKYFQDNKLNLKDNINIFKYEDNGDIKILSKKISGVFQTNIPDYDKYIVYTNIINNANKFYDSIVIKPRNMHLISDSNLTELDKYKTIFWDNKHFQFLNWLNSYDIPIKILLFFVSLICITNILATSHIEFKYRYNEIWLLNIYGIRKKTIKFIYAFKSIILLAAGSFVGFLLSYLFIFVQNSFNIIKIPQSVYFMDTLPINGDLNITIYVIGCMLFALSILILLLISSLKYEFPLNINR